MTEAPTRLAYALDLLNFSLADVRDGLGPYLSIYLLLTHHWDQASIGFVMGIGGIAAIVTQAPLGAVVDRTTAKRALVILAAVIVTAGALAMPLFPGFYPISVLQAVTGIAGGVFAPALAAITLGAVGPRLFARRIGRNESFNHAGNASAAALTGGLAYFFGPVVVFWVLAAMAVLSVAATLRIPTDAIDHDVARGMDHAAGQPHPRPSRLRVVLQNRRLMIFAVTMVAFHLANAAMLPLVGQLLALHNRDVGTALMAACIVAAQVVMVPVAYLAGAKADSWGRKPIFLVAFAVLAARGVLYTLWDNSYWLVGVQLLDGVGAGIFGALFPLVVQDVTHGSGRFNTTLGAVTAVWGVGAALSNIVAGAIVVAAGYDAAFLSLGAVAAAGLLLYLFAMPETGPTAGTGGATPVSLDGFGFGFGPRPRGGRRGGPGRRGRRGDVRAAILVLLAERPMHGYEMIREIAERSQDLWRPSPGSVYPTLQLLVDEGLIVGSETGGSKRLFALTDEGRTAAEKVETPPWDEIADGVDPSHLNLRTAVGQLFGAVAQSAHTAGPEQHQRIIDIVNKARREIYTVLSEDE